MSRNPCATTSLAKHWREKINAGYVMPVEFKWALTCTNCLGVGSVKAKSCCSSSCGDCPSCDGFGVENLGPSKVEPIE